jgi:hypothetical protein
MKNNRQHRLRSVKRPTSENVWWTSTVTRLQLWRTRDSPRKKIWWISTDPTEDRSVKVRVTANSLNDLRQITQNLVCRGLVSSGNHDVVSTTQGWQHPNRRLNQRDPPQESEKLMDLNKSWHIKFPKNRYQFNRWFHCLNPTDKRPESHSINVCSQRRTGTSLQRKRPRNHLMEGQPILISARS